MVADTEQSLVNRSIVKLLETLQALTSEGKVEERRQVRSLKARPEALLTLSVRETVSESRADTEISLAGAKI